MSIIRLGTLGQADQVPVMDPYVPQFEYSYRQAMLTALATSMAQLQVLLENAKRLVALRAGQPAHSDAIKRMYLLDEAKLKGYQQIYDRRKRIPTEALSVEIPAMIPYVQELESKYREEVSKLYTIQLDQLPNLKSQIEGAAKSDSALEKATTAAGGWIMLPVGYTAAAKTRAKNAVRGYFEAMARAAGIVYEERKLQGVQKMAYFLTLNISPGSASVYVDDVLVQNTQPIRIRVGRDNLPHEIGVGPHTLRVEHKYLIPRRQTFYVSAGRNVLIRSIKLEEASISITSDPRGSEVLVDGRVTGLATPCLLLIVRQPSRRDEVTPGQHTVTLKKEGYRSQTKSVTASLDRSSRLDFKLIELPPVPEIRVHVTLPVPTPPPVVPRPVDSAAREAIIQQAITAELTKIGWEVFPTGPAWNVSNNVYNRAVAEAVIIANELGKAQQMTFTFADLKAALKKRGYAPTSEMSLPISKPVQPYEPGPDARSQIIEAALDKQLTRMKWEQRPAYTYYVSDSFYRAAVAGARAFANETGKAQGMTFSEDEVRAALQKRGYYSSAPKADRPPPVPTPTPRPPAPIPQLPVALPPATFPKFPQLPQLPTARRAPAGLPSVKLPAMPWELSGVARKIFTAPAMYTVTPGGVRVAKKGVTRERIEQYPWYRRAYRSPEDRADEIRYAATTTLGYDPKASYAENLAMRERERQKREADAVWLQQYEAGVQPPSEHEQCNKLVNDAVRVVMESRGWKPQKKLVSVNPRDFLDAVREMYRRGSAADRYNCNAPYTIYRTALIAAGFSNQPKYPAYKAAPEPAPVTIPAPAPISRPPGRQLPQFPELPQFPTAPRPGQPPVMILPQLPPMPGQMPGQRYAGPAMPPFPWA